MLKSKEIIRRFQLIKFIGDDQNDTALLSIDRVPRRWIRYDVDSGQTVVKFPPPPYNSKQKQATLEKLIKSEGDPLPEWIEYPVQLVGHADTYKESLDRLVTLETKPYAYTSESDTAPKKKASQIVEELKKQSLQKIMEVTEIEDENEDEDNSEYLDNPNSSSSSENSCAKPSFRKARVTGKKLIRCKKVSESESGSTDSDSSRSIDSSKLISHQTSLKLQRAKKMDSTALKAKSVDSDSSRSKSSKASKSSKMAPLKKSQAVSQLQKGTKKQEEKKKEETRKEKERKKVCKPLSTDSLRSVTGEASKVSKTNIEQNAGVTISKKYRDPALILAGTSESPCDVLNIEHDADVIDIIFSEGAYAVQESGELTRLIDEQRGASYNELPKTIPDKIHHHLLKSSNFDESLSKASDSVRSTGKKYTEDTLLLLSAIKGLSTDLKENTNAINDLCAAVRNSKVSPNTDSKSKALVLETDLDLPFKTLENFKIFDNQLKDTKYRQHCAASLLFYIDRDNCNSGL